MRVRTSYLQAFGRAPTESELRAMWEFFTRFAAAVARTKPNDGMSAARR